MMRGVPFHILGRWQAVASRVAFALWFFAALAFLFLPVLLIASCAAPARTTVTPGTTTIGATKKRTTIEVQPAPQPAPSFAPEPEKVIRIIVPKGGLQCDSDLP
jgi:hypothetical protein